MRFTLLFAWRYLIGKKSTNAINIITGVAIAGIGIGTAALIIVLSVFNGFEDLLSSLMNTVNADVKVIPATGKTFTVDSALVARLDQLEGVESVSLTLEETALIEYDGNQDFCVLKGVEDNYGQTTTIDSAIVQGAFVLSEDDLEFLVMGGGLANRLNVNLGRRLEPVKVYMPKRNVRSPAEAPFKTRIAYPSGKFAIKQDYDYTYVFCSLAFARDVIGIPDGVSAIEINVAGTSPGNALRQQIAEALGDGVVIRDRYEQNDALFKLMNIEKWLSYAIAGLTLFIVSFNLVGALWMIVLDKKRDLSILQAMGATSRQLYRLIMTEGMLMSIVGIGVGVAIALVLYVLQKTVGIITFPEGFVVEAYPIELRFTDLLVVFTTVLLIGVAASLLPARRGAMISAYVREE